jgi:c-di-GMP-binding flagellar brake protein YcgR
MTEPADHPPSLLTEPQHVTQPVQIAGILRRLKDAHALIRVSLPGASESWLSAVIDVQPGRGQLLIDELSPREGNGALQRARRAIVSAQIQGVDISFATNLVEAGQSDGLPYYCMTLPDTIRYWQRRASFRVRVSAATIVPVELVRDDGVRLSGELVDISAGGIGTRHKTARSVLPLLGEEWKDCRIVLPDAQEIRCALEIRYVGRDDRSGLRLGARYLEIARPQLKLAENFVAHLERENLRKRRRARDS